MTSKPKPKRAKSKPPAPPAIDGYTAKINDLARVFYSAHGYEVEDGYPFHNAIHPQEKSMFALASYAFDFLIDEIPADTIIEEMP